MSFGLGSGLAIFKVDHILLLNKIVQASLVRQVNSLAGMGGPRKEKSLSQALAAFSFITIPSLRSPGSRLALYLETAQVARAKAQCSEPGTFMRIIIPQTCLLTGCHGQGEACLKAAIQLIGQTPACLEEKQLAEMLPCLLSTLLAVPDSPDRGPLHLARAALNAANKFPWSQVSV